MITQTKCKFCGCNLHLEIDDDYAKTNDIFKLVKLAACNRCGDLRVRRRGLHEAFVDLCGQVLPARKDEEAIAVIRKELENVTKEYLKLVGDWFNRNDLVWEACMVHPFIEKPAECGKHLGLFWKMSAQQELI